ncbi:MAG: hypothetical protein IH875_09315 [Candidatus Dadabacteria bacterium]|nr:hypothetical protein [Candidatus Dadabacteria bacterium]
MTYDENLAHKIGSILKSKNGINQKKMFEGLCYLLNGNMPCGINEDKLIARTGPEKY